MSIEDLLSERMSGASEDPLADPPKGEFESQDHHLLVDALDTARDRADVIAWNRRFHKRRAEQYAQRLAGLVEGLRARAVVGVSVVNAICMSKCAPNAPTHATEEGAVAIARRNAEEAMWRAEVEWIDALLAPEAEVPREAPHEAANSVSSTEPGKGSLGA